VKSFEIQIQGKAEADREFIEAFKNAQAGKKAPEKTGIYFTSIESVRNLLTEKRLELLHMVKTKHPHSIYQLAKLTGRNFKNVYEDIRILKGYGLVKMDRYVRKKKPWGISVPYRDINIHAWI